MCVGTATSDLCCPARQQGSIQQVAHADPEGSNTQTHLFMIDVKTFIKIARLSSLTIASQQKI